jgi:hypothetical protein
LDTLGGFYGWVDGAYWRGRDRHWLNGKVCLASIEYQLIFLVWLFSSGIFELAVILNQLYDSKQIGI